MIRAGLQILFVSLQFVLLDGLSWLVFRAYGPMACWQLCHHREYSFNSVLEYHCRRRPFKRRDNLQHKDSFVCLGEENGTKSEGALNTREGDCPKDYIDDRERLKETSFDVTLHRACAKGHLCLVKYILNKELADINCRGGGRRRTPVMTAANTGQKEVFDFLVKKGCDVSAVDTKGASVLHLACKAGRTEIVTDLVVRRKLHIESTGYAGWTPVMYAAYYGQRNVLEFLASQGCILTSVDNWNQNILHIACFGGFVDVVKVILSRNVVSIESRDGSGNTPVLIATGRGKVEVFDLLISKKCNLSAVNIKNNNILHMACIDGHSSMVNHIVSKDLAGIDSRGHIGRTPVMQAAYKGRRKCVDLLIRKGCNLEMLDSERNNLFHMACMGGHVNLVKLILAKNVLGIESKGSEGRTAVLLAACSGRKEVVKFLARKGCNLKSVDSKGHNILHMACVDGHIDMVRYVLTLGIVEKTAKTFYGYTAEKLAEVHGHAAVVTLLKTT